MTLYVMLTKYFITLTSTNTLHDYLMISTDTGSFGSVISDFSPRLLSLKSFLLLLLTCLPSK